jgi:hypothetical protein
METGTDPITMLLTTGGVSGVGGGALTAYIIAKMAGKNGNGNGNDAQNTTNELRLVAEKLDRTNELLTDLIRCQARLEGYMANSQNR